MVHRLDPKIRLRSADFFANTVLPRVVSLVRARVLALLNSKQLGGVPVACCFDGWRADNLDNFFARHAALGVERLVAAFVRRSVRHSDAGWRPAHWRKLPEMG
jgi:hypothetical protein